MYIPVSEPQTDGWLAGRVKADMDNGLRRKQGAAEDDDLDCEVSMEKWSRGLDHLQEHLSRYNPDSGFVRKLNMIIHNIGIACSILMHKLL